MSTNTNASNGASHRQPKREMPVREVDNKEVEERIATYTGDENTRFGFQFVLCTVGRENVVQAGNPAGSNVTVTDKGKQSSETIENKNYVTVPTRNEPVVDKDTKKEALAKKVAAQKAEAAKKAETNKDIR